MRLISTKSLILLCSTVALTIVSVEWLVQAKITNPVIIAVHRSTNEFVVQPANAQTENAARSKVIKIKIQDINSVSEWVRLEVSGNQVKLMHARSTPGTVSKLVGFLGAPPVDRRWFDHSVSRTVFEPDNCSQLPSAQPSPSTNCQVIGTNTIVLPQGTDVHQGRFTIEYTENDFTRSVSFRVPPNS